MRIDLRYGNGEESLLLPADADVEYVEPRQLPPLDDPGAALGSALKSPVGSEPLPARLSARHKVLIVVSDPTRGGTDTMLPVLVESLERMGIDSGSMSVLVARGTHRGMTREERKFLRAGALQGITINEHDCDNRESLSALLLTRRRTPVRVNRALRDADVVILLSQISFHYFAGFGGGRKLILPGCADRASIMANHRLSLTEERPARLHPSCRPGQLDENPVSEDMAEAIATLTNLFAVNFFCGADGTPVFINAGDPAASHAAACAAYAESHRVSLERSVPVLVLGAGGSPHDVNLLQAHKSLYHGCEVADGGTVLFYARCDEGIGSESLARALDTERAAFLDRAREDYDLNNQTAVSLLGLTARCRVGMVTELDPSVVEKAGMQPVGNPEAFLADALEQRGTHRVTVMRYGARTLPYISRGEKE